MNTKKYSVIGRRFSLFFALPLLSCLFLVGGTNTNASDKEDVYNSKTTSGEYKKSGPRRLISRIFEKGRKVKDTLVDHHRRERAFIIGLVTGGERRYERSEEAYRNPAPAPAHEYSQPAPAPQPAPVPAPVVVPEKKKTYKYPGYSGY